MERPIARTREEAIDTLLTKQQVAYLLQVSVGSVGRWSKKGKLKFYRVGVRGIWRYVLEDVVSFQRDIVGHQGTMPV